MSNKYTQKKAKELNILTRLYQLYAMYILFVPFSWLFYKIKYEGFENIEKGKPYIIAPNHISYLDVFIVALAVRQRISYMAKIELFQNLSFGGRYIARNIKRLGAFGVNRQKLELSTVKSVKEVAKAKWNLGIFPQGGIKKHRKIETINKGFITLAKMINYDILPIAITGCETYNWNIFKKPTIHVSVLPPISKDLDDDTIMQKWQDCICDKIHYEKLEINNQEKAQ